MVTTTTAGTKNNKNIPKTFLGSPNWGAFFYAVKNARQLFRPPSTNIDFIKLATLE